MRERQEWVMSLFRPRKGEDEDRDGITFGGFASLASKSLIAHALVSARRSPEAHSAGRHGLLTMMASTERTRSLAVG